MLNPQLSLCNLTPLTLVEVIVEKCANFFQDGACQSTAANPCYRTNNTCTDQCNYACSTESYWFSTCKIPSHLGIYNYVPNVLSTQHEPTKLKLGQTFSTRGKITVCFQDAPHTDEGFDSSWPRGAIPIRCPEDMPGTLWGRLLARHKNLEGLRVNVYTGFCEYELLCQFNKQSYFIDSHTGPDNACKFCLILKDPLVLAEKSKCPNNESKLVATSNLGSEFPLPFTLGGPMDGLDTDGGNPYALIGSNLLQNNYLVGDKEQDDCFKRLRHICVGKEVMRVRAVKSDDVFPAGWNIQLIERGACGSEISAHDGGSPISLAETFKGHIAEIIKQLFDCMDLEATGLSCCEDDPFCIIDWDSFDEFICCRPLDIITEDVVVCKGETVKTLLDELSAEFMFFLYYDAVDGKIRIKALKPPECDEEIHEVAECDPVDGSFTQRKTDDFYNVVEYDHTIVDCSSGLSAENLADTTAYADADVLRKPCDRRKHKQRSIKSFNSRWISRSNAYLAKTYGYRWALVRECVGKEISFEFTNEYADVFFELGGFNRICHHKAPQDTEGNPTRDLWIVKGIAPSEKCTRVSFERMPFNDNISPALNCDTNCPTFVTDVLDDCENDDCVGIW